MGFFKSIGKSLSKAVPKIKIGDPTKLITKPIEGVYNAAGTVTKSLVGNSLGVVGEAVGGVGGVLAQPGAGAVLGGVGAAFGVPGLGALAGAFSPTGAPALPPSGGQIQAPPVVISQAPQSGNNNTLLIAGGAGIIGIILVIILMKKKR